MACFASAWDGKYFFMGGELNLVSDWTTDTNIDTIEYHTIIGLFITKG